MKVGIQLIVSNHGAVTDAEMVRNEVRMGVEAEAMGFSHAAVGPLVRSSYHADQQAHAAGVA